MADTKTPGAGKRQTSELPFFACSPESPALFTVRAGVPLMDALNQASAIFSSVEFIIRDAAAEFDTPQLWGASYLAEVASAVLQSAISALNQEEVKVRHE